MVLYIGLGLTRELWLVIALIAFEAAFGWAQYITASNAMITDLTPPSRRAEAFSISRVALNAGITVGPLLAAPLIILDPSFRLAFLSGGVVCGVFLLMAVFRIRETRPPPGAGCFHRRVVSRLPPGAGRSPHARVLRRRAAAAVRLRPDLGDHADHAG